jgi:hypothetical protein
MSDPGAWHAFDPAALTAGLRHARPAVLGLLFSMWGARVGAFSFWRSQAGSRPLRSGLKAAACFAAGQPGVRHAVRAICWRRVHPRARELHFGSNSAVLRHPHEPESVFKAEIISCLHSPEMQRVRLRAFAAGYEGLRRHLGDFLEPTRFEQHRFGGRRVVWMTGAAQRYVPGEPFDPARRVDPALRRQWRSLCQAALEAEARSGLLVDLIGTGNVRIERCASRPPQLRIVDTVPLPALGSAAAPDVMRRLHERARRIVRAGASG